MLGIIVALVGSSTYAATPQQAVERVFALKTILRTNIVGRFAAISARGLIVEGQALNSALLVERFLFGWQTLDFLDGTCRLRLYGVASTQWRSLLVGMPDAAYRAGSCREARGDIGPRADVEAVRKQMQGPLVPSVRVAGDFALGQWYAAGGGQTLFGRKRAGWRVLLGGGGAIEARDARPLGIHEQTLCSLGVYQAICRVPQVSGFSLAAGWLPDAESPAIRQKP